MRFRTLALALALTFCVTGLAEAKKRPVTAHRSMKRSKSANRVKARKFKRGKASAKKAAKRHAKHA